MTTIRWAAAAGIGSLAAALAAPPALANGEQPASGAPMGDVVLATGAGILATGMLFGLGLAHRRGRTRLLARPAQRAANLAGLPVWVALPSATIAGSLLVALLGMYWDISLHIDVGRDAGPLANPAHYLILAGLFGVFASGFLAMVLAEGRPGPSAVRLTPGWQVPVGGLLVFACGAFALIGFPLDDAWHRLFGQDVTLWGPTHLMLIGGASLAIVGQTVLLVEGVRASRPSHAGPSAASLPRGPRIRRAALAGAFLIGLSTFQGEFDFGVPQFQLLFQPMLIALAAGAGLVSARVWGGRGAALAAVAFFLAVRGLISLTVGGVFGETTPHFPLYAVEALLVELAAIRISPRRRALLFGTVAGALIGTAGFASEWAWSHLWMTLPWPSSLLPEAFPVALAAALAGGLLGALIGRALLLRPAAPIRGARTALAAASAVVVALVAFGLSTSSPTGVRARVSLKDIPAPGGRQVAATVAIGPGQVAEEARWLTATAWQGGGLVVDPLRRVRPGVYRTTRPIPVHSGWKALLTLHHGDALQALPLYMPRDRAIPAPEIRAPRSFVRPFVPAKSLLQREARPGATGLTALAYGTVLALAVGLLGLLAWGLARAAASGVLLQLGARPTDP